MAQDNTRLLQLAGLMSLTEGKKKTQLSDVKAKVEPPEGLFAGKPAKILKWIKANHPDQKSAMACLTFYINRAGKDLDADKKAELNGLKDQIKAAYAVKESFDLLRKMAGLAPLPESKEEVEDSASDNADGDDDEEELPAIIKKIAKSAEGKEGEELEDLLMKVYEAGQKDGKKQAEEAAKGDAVEEGKKHKAKPVDLDDEEADLDAAPVKGKKKEVEADELPLAKKK